MNLERQIVGFIPRRFLAAAPSAAVAAATAAVAAITAAAFAIAAPAHHVHFGKRYLQRIARLAVSVGIAAPPQAALNIYLLPPGQILVADFTQPPERATVEPLGFLALLAVGTPVAAVRRHAKASNRLPAGGIAHFRFTANVADDNNFVQGYSPVTLTAVPVAGYRAARHRRPARAQSPRR